LKSPDFGFEARPWRKKETPRCRGFCALNQTGGSPGNHGFKGRKLLQEPAQRLVGFLGQVRANTLTLLGRSRMMNDCGGSAA